MTIETYLHLLGEMEEHEQAALIAFVRQENSRAVRRVRMAQWVIPCPIATGRP